MGASRGAALGWHRGVLRGPRGPVGGDSVCRAPCGLSEHPEAGSVRPACPSPAFRDCRGRRESGSGRGRRAGPVLRGLEGGRGPTWLCSWMRWPVASSSSRFSVADMALILPTSTFSQAGPLLGASPTVTLPGGSAAPRSREAAWDTEEDPPASRRPARPGPHVTLARVCRKNSGKVARKLQTRGTRLAGHGDAGQGAGPGQLSEPSPGKGTRQAGTENSA